MPCARRGECILRCYSGTHCSVGAMPCTYTHDIVTLCRGSHTHILHGQARSDRTAQLLHVQARSYYNTVPRYSTATPLSSVEGEGG